MNNRRLFRNLGCALSLEGLTSLFDCAAVSWPELIGLAGHQLVSPVLAGTISDKGWIDQLAPEDWAYLQTIRDLNRIRNQTLYTELVQIAATLNAVGIEPQLLKGASVLLPEQYPGAEDRVIGDLDLRVPVACYEQAANAIRALGYRDAEGCDYHSGDHHHGIPLLHPSAPVTVELHIRTLRDRTDNELLEAGQHLSPVVFLGKEVRAQLADVETRLLHNFLHSQINDLAYINHRLDLRQLLEFTRLAHEHRATLDWSSLIARLQPKHHRIFCLYLLMAEYWLGAAYPDELGRPWTGVGEIQLIALAQSSPGWYQFFRLLPRWSNLPKKLLKPSWYPQKIRALRRGEPW